MKNAPIRTLVFTTIMTLVATPLTTSSLRAADEQLSDEGYLVKTVTAKVENINYDNRELMLVGPMNEITVLAVGKGVKRLNEIKAGDYVTTEYYISKAMEVRKPTDDELVNTISVTNTKGKAPLDMPPGSYDIDVISVTAAVEGLNANTNTLSFVTAAGHHYTVEVKDPTVLTTLRLGDKVRVTCTKATVRTIVKAPPEAAKAVEDSAKNQSRAAVKK